MRVYAAPYLGSSPFYIAEAEGYYAAQGLNVEFVPLKSSLDAVPALTQGDIDVVVSSANVGLFNTIARDGPLRLVGGTSLLDPSGCVYMGMIGQKSLIDAGDLEQPAQFRGLRLTTGSLGLEGFYIDQYLGRDGLSLSDLQVDDLAPSVVGEALANGSLDVANIAEPWMTRVLRDGNAKLIIAAKDVMPNTQTTVVTYGPNLLSKHPDVGKRFMAATVQGIRKYLEGKTPANLKVISEFTGLDTQLLEDICLPTMSDDGALRAESLVPFEQWAFQKGAVDKVLNPSEFWDSRFTDAEQQP